ncbi:lipid-A-disaccharide synthase [Marinobacterium nitratireducens]|uniref:Lipid-A-disaccharide synthase n=1 Tax=Marinobacterium nitratireducens TaxID=518897 RepID=A0A917ZC66_9GAMM|nr:lipid-A-disaccharide synthase [Marinobacterium nitratireducens]GGO78854.1 lipid-A-disaccharide synthase [Marinobacterium nitratireducens]
MALRIGIVAGEASGDILGAGLIEALRRRYPDLEVEGIGGDLMVAAGCRSLYPMERLSVMGLVEVLGRLRELMGIRKALAEHFEAERPHLFIGIDAPDFTLNLEGRLREAGIPTVHYVSPSVWAWRRKRVFKILGTTDLMLTLFPFEAHFYREHGQRVAFVGHPLASRIPEEPDKGEARQALGLPADTEVVALLPGSRGGELKYLARPFLETARWLRARRPNVRFVLPAANEARLHQLHELVQGEFADLEVELMLKHSREAMQAADAILIASGTATLEAMLLKRPMVVAYRMAGLTHFILSRLIKSPYISLPNLLADAPLVPEVLQDEVRPEVLGPLLLKQLEDPANARRLKTRFTKIHRELNRDADERAADAIVELLQNRER